MLIEKRFLKYVSFDTQSDESSTTSPSTEKQFDLADFLSEEMQIRELYTERFIVILMSL